MIEHNFVLMQRLRRTVFAFKCAKLINNELLVHLLLDKHVKAFLGLITNVWGHHCVFVHVVFVVFEDV